MESVGTVYSAPIRLIPPGWTPPNWVEDKDNNVFAPQGVRYFTPQEALEVASLCPSCFPKYKLSDMTAYFALTQIASNNRMACIRALSERGEGRIVAVGMLGMRDSLLRGKVSFISIITTADGRDPKLRSRLYTALYKFLVDFAKEETYPVIPSRAPEHEI